MTPPLTVFSHMCSTPSGKKITQQQWDLFLDSKLIHYATFYLYANWDLKDYDWFIPQTKPYKNVHVVNVPGTTPTDYEFPTLLGLKDFCDKATEEQYVLYIHHKGAFHGGHHQRRTMEYWMINEWTSAVSYLQDYETVGLGLRRNDYTHTPWNNRLYYPCNFWWARASYIKTLPVPNKPAKADKIQRYYAEQWLGTHDFNGVDIQKAGLKAFNWDLRRRQPKKEWIPFKKVG